ncbi:MAG: ATP-dependent Clp protease adaptor ClpS [Candidatus Krumholzibacteriia bacterium]
MQPALDVVPLAVGPQAPAPARKGDVEARSAPRHEPLYNVVLLDDDEHTYEYVIEMLCALFGHSIEESLRMASEVDREGRVIVDTTHRERAELKRDQIHGFGADPLLRGSRGSMRATIEPVTG